MFWPFEFEGGTHRVQRVPETEKQGRVHTSTATVAVVPEAEDVDLVIEAKDLRIDTYCSSGPGGQKLINLFSHPHHSPSRPILLCNAKMKNHSIKIKKRR